MTQAGMCCQDTVFQQHPAPPPAPSPTPGMLLAALWLVPLRGPVPLGSATAPHPTGGVPRVPHMDACVPWGTQGRCREQALGCP